MARLTVEIRGKLRLKHAFLELGTIDELITLGFGGVWIDEKGHPVEATLSGHINFAARRFAPVKTILRFNPTNSDGGDGVGMRHRP